MGTSGLSWPAIVKLASKRVASEDQMCFVVLCAIIVKAIDIYVAP